ncbi:TPA: hypothetical protein ACIFST_004178 [Citrobacter farmeri]
MSTITREQAQAVSDLKAGYTLGHADVAILKELARIALASLEAEPVGTFRKGPCGYSPSFHEDAMPLYAAPPAPVVPDKMTYQDGVVFVLNNGMSSIERGTVARRAWNACRAAMLQGQPDRNSTCK